MKNREKTSQAQTHQALGWEGGKRNTRALGCLLAMACWIVAGDAHAPFNAGPRESAVRLRSAAHLQTNSTMFNWLIKLHIK